MCAALTPWKTSSLPALEVGDEDVRPGHQLGGGLRHGLYVRLMQVGLGSGNAPGRPSNRRSSRCCRGLTWVRAAHCRALALAPRRVRTRRCARPQPPYGVCSADNQRLWMMAHAQPLLPRTVHTKSTQHRMESPPAKQSDQPHSRARAGHYGEAAIGCLVAALIMADSRGSIPYFCIIFW